MARMIVIAVATTGTPRLFTVATDLGAMLSNDHAKSVRGGWSDVSARITGQKSTNVATRKTAKTVLLTCAEVSTKYAPDEPSWVGSPPPKAAARNDWPNEWKKIATN